VAFVEKSGEHYSVISCQQLQQQFPILLLVVIRFLLVRTHRNAVQSFSVI